MGKISFSGERPVPFDGMKMEYDAKKGREENEVKRSLRKAEFFKKKQAENLELDKIEELWNLQDNARNNLAMSKPSYINSKDWSISETDERKHGNSKYLGRTGQHKGLPSIRKLKQADDPELGFEVPEDN